MPQFTIYRNNNPQSKAAIPYLLDVQSDLLAELNTRVVIPLYLKKTLNVKPMIRLMPEFTVENRKTLLMTPQLAGVSIKHLGAEVGAAMARRDEIIAALDLLMTGV